MKTDSETVRYLETARGILIHKDDIISMIQLHMGAYRKLKNAACEYPESPIYNAAHGSCIALMKLADDVMAIGGDNEN